MCCATLTRGRQPNHRSVTRAGVTLAVYAQYTYDREKREALALWAERLYGIVAAGAQVLRIAKRKARSSA